MFKKLCFHWFGDWLNMGYVVEIPDDHAISLTGGTYVWCGPGTSHLGEKIFLDSVKDQPLGRWLRQHYPHQLKFKLHTDWSHHNMLDWYQEPRYRIELSSVRFFHAADAVSFKLGFL